MCITDLSIGQTGIITAIDTTDERIQQLMVMGLVEGTIVKHISTAGSAYEFKFFDSTIAFSKEQAQHFTVELV